MRKFNVIIPLLFIFVSSCFLFKQAAPFSTTLQDKDDDWVNETINSMSLDEKIGQMIMPFARYESRFKPFDMIVEREIIKRYHVGGFVIRSKDVYTTLKNNNELQILSKIPLFIAQDYETGVGGRTKDGTEFISMLGVGATGNPEYAYDIGRITALESRAIGINLLFAPCADVNSNPLNRIINTRSFGENPETVAQFVSEFVKGAQDFGVLTTVKHFPGHGGTAKDSHHELPVLNKSMQQLQKHELVPFIKAIKSGTAAVMTSHISLPQVAEEKNLPATLSWKIMDELLKEKLNFQGLLITDGFSMDAIKNNYFEGVSVVKAIHAGIDILLLPQNLPLAIYTIKQAVERKEISIDRLNQSVKRILTWKSRLGLHKNAITPETLLDKNISRSESKNKSKGISRKAVTVLNNEILPLQTEKINRIFVLNFNSHGVSNNNGIDFARELNKLNNHVMLFQVTPDLCNSKVDTIAKLSRQADVIINNYFFKRTGSPDNPNFSETQNALIDSLFSINDSIVNIFFGSPYYAMNFPNFKNLIFMYRNSKEMEKIAAEAVTGKIQISGRLPVSIPNIAKSGGGESVEKYNMQLEKVDYKNYAKNPQFIDSLKLYLQKSIADSAFPGCAVAVGYKGKLLLNVGFGHFTYDVNSAKVQTNSIFDLASVTKVVSTTSAAMILYDRGLLNLDWKVQDILPDFLGKEKGMVTVRHLLTHSSGLSSWRRYYLDFKGIDQIRQQIYKENLEYTPGTLTMYSDLGMILMQNIIEVISQKHLNDFVDEEIFKPLEMSRTFYNPDKKFLPEIVPTEKSDFHKKIVHGFVHDENTWAMGGVSGHAGLFSTTEDLAKFCQMMLNKGLYGFKRILSENTIEYFTKRDGKVAGSTRAIGWDTRSEEKSSSGHFMSMKAFGHTGFTGTSIWMDPENEVFVILLTNRVHPTRENHKIRKVRPQVADYAMKAILGAKK